MLLYHKKEVLNDNLEDFNMKNVETKDSGAPFARVQKYCAKIFWFTRSDEDTPRDKSDKIGWRYR
jgi:hypothetical protein